MLWTPKLAKTYRKRFTLNQTIPLNLSDVPHLNVKVYRGMTHDGIGKYLSQILTKAPGPTDNIVQILKDTKTDVVVSYLPVGSEMATKWYVEQILEAGCAFVNAIPVFIASSDYWAERFRERGLPIIGDDIKSQVGATILHRVINQPVCGPRRTVRPHLPAEFWRQYRFLKYVGTGTFGIKKDFQNRCRNQYAALYISP